jgi:hypothetical protein
VWSNTNRPVCNDAKQMPVFRINGTTKELLPYFLAYKTHQLIRCTPIFSLEILETMMINVLYFNFSNLLEENRIVTYEN